MVLASSPFGPAERLADGRLRRGILASVGALVALVRAPGDATVTGLAAAGLHPTLRRLDGWSNPGSSKEQLCCCSETCLRSAYQEQAGQRPPPAGRLLPDLGERSDQRHRFHQRGGDGSRGLPPETR